MPDYGQPHPLDPQVRVPTRRDAGNDPRYDDPLERQKLIDEMRPEYARGGAGKDRQVVDQWTHIEADPMDPRRGELIDAAGAPKDRVANTPQWIGKVNPDAGKSDHYMNNCPDVTRKVAEIMNGGDPKLANGNAAAKGEHFSTTLEWMGLKNYSPENSFKRPPGTKGDFSVDDAALGHLRNKMHGRPVGTHAIIRVQFETQLPNGQWVHAGGHHFNAFVDVDGRVKFLDGQPPGGRIVDGNRLFPNNITELQFSVREPGGKWEGIPADADTPPATQRRFTERSPYERGVDSTPDGGDGPEETPDILGTEFPDQQQRPATQAEQPSMADRLGGQQAQTPPVRPEPSGSRQPSFEDRLGGGQQAHTPPVRPEAAAAQQAPVGDRLGGGQPGTPPVRPEAPAAQPPLGDRLEGGQQPEMSRVRPETPGPQQQAARGWDELTQVQPPQRPHAPEQPSQAAGRGWDDLTELHPPQRPHAPEQPSNQSRLSDILDGNSPNRPPAAREAPRHTERPATHPEQPPARAGQPSGHPEQPAARAGQPSGHPEQPPARTGQPSGHAEQPGVRSEQPPVFRQEPSAGTQRISGNLYDGLDLPPARHSEQPPAAHTQQQPATRTEQPAAHAHQQPGQPAPPRPQQPPASRPDGKWRIEGDLNDGISRSEWQAPATRGPGQPSQTPPRRPEDEAPRHPGYEQPRQPEHQQPGQAEQQPRPVDASAGNAGQNFLDEALGKSSPDFYPEDYGFPPAQRHRQIDAETQRRYDAEAEEFAAKATREEAEAVDLMTANEYQFVNKALYKGYSIDDLPELMRKDGNSGLTPRAIETARRFRELLRKAEPAPAPRRLYRGVRAPRGMKPQELLAWAREKFKLNEPINFGGFQHTSIDPKVAAGFTTSADRIGVVFEMHTRKGAPLGKLSSREGSEGEYALPDNERFVPVGISEKITFDSVKPGTDGGPTVGKIVIHMVDIDELDYYFPGGLPDVR